MGINAGIMMPVIGMVRHWTYGLVLAGLYPLPAGAAVEADRNVSFAVERRVS
ncbi:MAG: hypothetical protein HY660_16885 [Armatimonadetes bacterium]|nr:hypothetical protein [Armatimonadota bacterium]